MFKTIIADLDNKNIGGIRSYISTNASQFRVDRTFTTEKDLFKYLKTNDDIDLIIMEIRFLGVDFITKTTDLYASYPNIKFIVYGVLQDFGYLKKALELGAVAYIVRPVKSTELKKALNSYIEYSKFNETLQKEKKMLNMEYVQNFKLFEDKFLSVLINESIFDDKEIETSLNYFNIHITPPYSIAIFRIDSFRKYILNKSQKEKHLISFKISKIINNNISNCKTFINLFNEVVVILSGKYKRNDLFELLKDVNLKIMEETNILTSCGVGRLYDAPTKIHTSFLEAITALRYRCIMGYNSVIFIDDAEPDNVFTSSYPYEREKLLVYISVIGDYFYCVKLLDNIFDDINQFKEKFEEILPQIIMSMLISISRNAFEQGLNIDPISNFFDTKTVLSLKTTDEAYTFLKDGLKEFCTYILNLRKDKEIQMFNNSVSYMNQNYKNSISYKSIAKELGYNPKYLKTIFESNAKNTIELFIAEIRIEHAKKLILTTNLTDELIALKIGYNDVNSFRQAFKNVVGYMVGDFRFIKRKNN